MHIMKETLAEYNRVRDLWRNGDSANNRCFSVWHTPPYPRKRKPCVFGWYEDEEFNKDFFPRESQHARKTLRCTPDGLNR